MAKYKLSSKSLLTVNYTDSNGKPAHIRMSPGDEAELPLNSFVESCVRRNILTPLDAPAPAEAKPKRTRNNSQTQQS